MEALKFHPLIFILILITNLSLSFSATFEEHYVNCAPLNFTCGSTLNVSYPFWVSSRPSYCGHPSFKLECGSGSSQQAFSLKLQNQTYNVQDINYTSRVIRVVKQSFSRSPCPDFAADLQNTSLDLSYFEYASNSRNVSMFYNCSGVAVSKPTQFFFTCPRDASSPPFASVYNYLVITDDKQVNNNLRSICMSDVFLPVFRNQVSALENRLTSVYEVVTKGFALNWEANEKDCGVCVQTGGRCGFNRTINRPICLCKDGVYVEACDSPAPDGRKKMRSTLILIGLLVGGAFVIGIVIAVFFIRRYKKAKTALPEVAVPNVITRVSRLDPSTSRTYNYFGVNIFSYGELEEATASFDRTNEIGRGGYGVVYRGTLSDGREVAIKRTFERSDRNIDQFLNEIEILTKVTHSNLVTLYGCTSHESRELLLVYEYISNGTCADHLHGSKAELGLLTWPRRLSLAVSTASALVYLHSLGIIHRDVKTQNLLLDEDLSVKVGDFGISRLFPVDASHVSTNPYGTPGYADPDYYRTYRLTDRSDVYSFGVVLAELISSKKAVDLTRKEKDINLATMFQETVVNSALDEFVDPFLGFDTNADIKGEVKQVGRLAFRCLEKEKIGRPSMQDVYNELHRIQLKEEEAGPSIQALIDELRNQTELPSIAETSEIVEIP